MRSTILTAVGLSLAFAAPCFAQSSQSSTSSPPAASAAQPLVKGKTGTEAGKAPAAPGTQQQANAGTETGSMSGSAGTQQQANAGTQPNAIQKQMKKELAQAGFTDVKIMPESFLIRAKDKEGRPVMMVVNPDSVLAVTKMGGSSKMANAANSGGSSTKPTTTAQ